MPDLAATRPTAPDPVRDTAPPAAAPPSATPPAAVPGVLAARAPGPRANCLPGYQRDHPAMAVRLQREYGDVVRMRIGPFLVHQLTHPDVIRHVLLDNPHNFRRGRFYEGFSAYFGRGLLTTDDEEWRRHRSVSQPVFHPQRIEALGEAMTSSAVDLRERLESRTAREEPFDLVGESMRYTISVLGRALFSADLGATAAEVTPAVQTGLGLIMQRMNPAQRVIPSWLPTRHNRRLVASRAVLDRILDEVIAEHVRLGRVVDGDLVSHHLGLSGDVDPARRLSAHEARDGLMTTFLAGHETTGTSLAWTLYTLAMNPAVRRRLEEEVDAVLGDRPATVADLPRLTYTRAVVQESLRLYPPIWLYPRDVVADDVIGGYRVPAGSTIFISPYVTHRHPDLWDNPEAFDPDRFTPEREAARPRHAYLPFGFGQRQCIGKHLALLQLQIAVATLARSVHLHPLSGRPVTYRAKVSLRPRQAPDPDVLLTAHRRPTRPEVAA